MVTIKMANTKEMHNKLFMKVMIEGQEEWREVENQIETAYGSVPVPKLNDGEIVVRSYGSPIPVILKV